MEAQNSEAEQFLLLGPKIAKKKRGRQKTIGLNKDYAAGQVEIVSVLRRVDTVTSRRMTVLPISER